MEGVDGAGGGGAHGVADLELAAAGVCVAAAFLFAHHFGECGAGVSGGVGDGFQQVVLAGSGYEVV